MQMQEQTKIYHVIGKQLYGIVEWKDIRDPVHCTTGPAGYDITTHQAVWYIDGFPYTLPEWCHILNKSKNEHAVLLLKYTKRTI